MSALTHAEQFSETAAVEDALKGLMKVSRLTTFSTVPLVVIAGIDTGTINFDSDISCTMSNGIRAPHDCNCWWDRDGFWLDRRVRLASLGDSSLCAVVRETWARDRPT